MVLVWSVQCSPVQLDAAQNSLYGFISDYPIMFNGVHKSYTPARSPGSRSDENATLENAKKNKK